MDLYDGDDSMQTKRASVVAREEDGEVSAATRGGTIYKKA